MEEIKEDYQNGNMQLCTALDKFAERYKAAKLKSIPWLASFFYDLNRNLDLTTRVKSGPIIRIQVESIKWRKSNESDHKRKLPAIKDKENLDPQIIPSRKKRKVDKKKHNLSENIENNQLN